MTRKSRVGSVWPCATTSVNQPIPIAPFSAFTAIGSVGCASDTESEEDVDPIQLGTTALSVVGQRVTVDVRDYLVLARDGRRYRRGGQTPQTPEDFIIEGARNADGEYVTVIVNYSYVPGVGRIREQGADMRTGSRSMTNWIVPLNDRDHAPTRIRPYAQSAW